MSEYSIKSSYYELGAYKMYDLYAQKVMNGRKKIQKTLIMEIYILIL